MSMQKFLSAIAGWALVSAGLWACGEDDVEILVDALLPDANKDGSVVDASVSDSETDASREDASDGSSDSGSDEDASDVSDSETDANDSEIDADADAEADGSSPICEDTPECNWCHGEPIKNEAGCIVDYRCANGDKACETTPCDADNPCRDGFDCHEEDLLCWESPSTCNWCNGVEVEGSQPRKYRCSNGIDPCEVGPCPDQHQCDENEQRCNTTTGLCVPKGDICQTPECNWCGGTQIINDRGCVEDYLCSNGALACSTDPCSTENPCEDGFTCGDDELCWPNLRKCEVTLNYKGVTQPYVAGEFNGWSTTANPMRSVGPNQWAITLSASDGNFTPGEITAYKLVVGGEWMLDPNSIYRKYDDGTLNSGFLFPDCAKPEISMQKIETEWTGSGGTYATSVRIVRGSGNDAVSNVTFLLDGQAIEGEFDSLHQTYSLSGNASAGRHVLTVKATDAGGNKADDVASIFWIEEKPFNWHDTALYLLFLDRFANGDKTNDAPVNDSGILPIVNWHGGDLKGAQKVLESGYFESLGAKAIWLSPVNKQVAGAWGESGGSHQIVGYHGYWPISGREVEPRYGGEKALKAFVDAAHKRGIRVLLDLINNQIHEQHEYFVAHPEWFRTGCTCGTSGCDWDSHALDCMFTPYLPDINWQNPEAEKQFIADAMYWIDEFGVDGFRVDAVKHVETNAVYNMRAAINRKFEQGGTRVVMIGETAVGENDYSWIEAYVGEHALDGQFDFPTFHRMEPEILNGSIDYHTVEQAIKLSEERYSPSALHVAYLGSHDTSRMVTRAAMDSECKWSDQCQIASTQTDEGVYQRLKAAWTLLMGMPQIPLIYNGDEVAIPGGNDPDMRRDMIWDSDYSDIAVGNVTPNAQQLDLREWIRQLATARAEHPAITQGKRRELWIEYDKYIFARYDQSECVLFVINRGDAYTFTNVGLDLVGWSGHEARTIMGNATHELNGSKITITIPGGSSSVIVVR